MTTVRQWNATQVAALNIEQASALREQIKSTLISADGPTQRRATLALLAALDRRISRTVEERTASARDFLRPPKSKAVADRSWAVAVALHGSRKEARRRGYSDPAESGA